MRIAVDGTFLGTGRGGDETLLRSLLAGLALCRGEDDTFPLLLARDEEPPEEADPAAFPVVRVPRTPGPVHFAAVLPTVLRRLGPVDLALSITHAPLLGRAPSALVVTDLSFVHRPGDYPRATARRLNGLVPQHVARARVVLVPSAATRRDVVDTFGADPAGVHVVPVSIAPAVQEPVDPDTVRALRDSSVRPPYLLYLGNLHPRKNVPELIGAFRALRTDPALGGHRLVVAGGRWFSGSDEERAAAGDPSVVFLGRVSEAQRVQLLRDAAAVAYLSLFEGFGLPPLEAMAYGTPVIASRCTSLPEVCGDAAVLVDPTDREAVRAGLRTVLLDERVRDRLRSAGPRQAAGFDAARTGTAAISAFRTAVGAADPRPPTPLRPEHLA